MTYPGNLDKIKVMWSMSAVLKSSGFVLSLHLILQKHLQNWWKYPMPENLEYACLWYVKHIKRLSQASHHLLISEYFLEVVKHIMIRMIFKYLLVGHSDPMYVIVMVLKTKPWCALAVLIPWTLLKFFVINIFINIILLLLNL